jgi:hypothetical protein
MPRSLIPNCLMPMAAAFSGRRLILRIRIPVRVTYQIVGEDEADIKQRKLSIGVPDGTCLIGKYAGDIAQVQAPGGIREYEIIDIRYE